MRLCLLQNHLCCRTDQKILLVHPKQPALAVAVIRVEEKGQIAADVGLIKVDALLDQLFLGLLQIEQLEDRPLRRLITGHIDLVHPRSHLLLPNLHRIAHLGAAHPIAGLSPAVRVLLLLVLLKPLTKQPEVVCQSDALSIQSQGCNRIQKAGCQSAQSTVAQRRLCFQFLDGSQRTTLALQQVVHLLIEP